MSDELYTGAPYPKYQYSVFPSGNKGEQLVIRTNTFKELVKAKKNIDKITTKRQESTPDASTPPEGLQNGSHESTGQSNIPICPYHNKEMVKRTGQYGEFWSCSTKLADGSWCKYKPDKGNAS